MDFQQALEVARVNGEDFIPTVCWMCGPGGPGGGCGKYMPLSKTAVLPKLLGWTNPRSIKVQFTSRAMLHAVKFIQKAGIKLDGDLIVQVVPEEGLTQMGTLACCQKGYKADAAIIPEPSGMNV